MIGARPYLAQLSLQTRLHLQYRAAALAGFSTQLFFGWVRIAVLTAFYAGGAPAPMPLASAIEYVWWSQALFLLIPLRVDPQVAAAIRQGTIANELLRPVDPFWMWYIGTIGRRAAPTAMRALPLLAVAAVLGGIHPAASWSAALAAVAALALAIAFSAAITVAVSLTAFWTVAGEGIAMLVPTLLWVFSGISLPLPLFPEWMQPMLAALPFRALIDTPVRLWTGDLPPGECIPALVHQAAWLTATVLLGRWGLGRGLRRLTVAGG